MFYKSKPHEFHAEEVPAARARAIRARFSEIERERDEALKKTKWAVWTKSSPTQPGWYWVTDGQYTKICLIYVTDDRGQLYIDIGEKDNLPIAYFIKKAKPRFSGPIPEPKEAI